MPTKIDPITFDQRMRAFPPGMSQTERAKTMAEEWGMAERELHRRIKRYEANIKGTSTLYGADGEVRLQWLKTDNGPRRGPSVEEAADILRTALEDMPRAEKIKPPKRLDADLLAVIPIGDPHVGMYAWAQEAGEDFDADTAERNMVHAVEHLTELAPPARECLLINLGDYFHADNHQNRTARSGHLLDVDSRYPRVIEIGVRAMRRCIDRCLERHERVRVWCCIGNHDDDSSLWLALSLGLLYEREPRVDVVTPPRHFMYHQHGNCLIAAHHGHGPKMQQLGPVMATDEPQMWGATRYRHWYTGHIHHDRLMELHGCTVESFATLAAKDAYAYAGGYRASRTLKLDVWHREHGMINRHVVGIQQVESRSVT